MFHIRLARRTLDSKTDENRCKQKYELIQVMCILYRYTEGKKSLAIYFEDSQFRRNRTFNFILSNIYVDKRSRIR